MVVAALAAAAFVDFARAGSMIAVFQARDRAMDLVAQACQGTAAGAEFVRSLRSPDAKTSLEEAINGFGGSAAKRALKQKLLENAELMRAVYKADALSAAFEATNTSSASGKKKEESTGCFFVREPKRKPRGSRGEGLGPGGHPDLLSLATAEVSFRCSTCLGVSPRGTFPAV